MVTPRPSSPLVVRAEGRLLIATIDRPPDNTVDRALAAEVRHLCLSLREEGGVDILILTSSTPAAFCRGTSPSLLDEARDAGSAAAVSALLEAYRCANAIASLPFPVIAAVEGDTFDQGLEIALAADLRIAGADARFRMAQVATGLVPWDGGTQRLPRAAGRGAAIDMLLTGRTMDATEAAAVGLVNRVTPSGRALDAARETAEQALKGAPIAARYAKEAVHAGMDMPLDQGILLETDLTMVLQTTRDRAEGIRSFLERRPPTFTGE